MKNKMVKNDLLRLVLICCGWAAIAGGIVGIFLPLIPTIPFLLLAAACFARSSEKFHSWLVQHNHLGPLIRDYLHSGSIPRRAKQMAIGMIWISFPASAFLFLPKVWMQVLVLSVAAAVTLYILNLPTATTEKSVAGRGESGT